mmetsp:Transcript_15398/g.30915  ORF Transcript_15398/g.30915 Transcript_15398/m.30915 type:complete len:149 (+) Transcript_15398:2019-2465(+)
MQADQIAKGSRLAESNPPSSFPLSLLFLLSSPRLGSQLLIGITQRLVGAFGGSSRTTCVIAASPDDAHGENTVQALRFGERCATITNSAAIGAVSAAQAMALVDDALATCEQSMCNLEAKDRTSLPAYGALKARHASLQMRRQALVAS